MRNRFAVQLLIELPHFVKLSLFECLLSQFKHFVYMLLLNVGSQKLFHLTRILKGTHGTMEANRYIRTFLIALFPAVLILKEAVLKWQNHTFFFPLGLNTFHKFVLLLFRLNANLYLLNVDLLFVLFMVIQVLPLGFDGPNFVGAVNFGNRFFKVEGRLTIAMKHVWGQFEHLFILERHIHYFFHAEAHLVIAETRVRYLRLHQLYYL